MSFSTYDIGYRQMIQYLSFQFKKGAEKYRTLKSKLHAWNTHYKVWLMGMAKVNWAPVELEVPDLNLQLVYSLYQLNGFTPKSS